VLVAVATEGQGRVNQHFGHATEFQIYEVSRKEALFVGHRRVDLYCQGGYGEDEQLPSIVNAINDCHAVLVSKIGACPRDELKAAGIEPVEEYAHEFIEKAALAWFADYCTRVASGEIVHQARGDARIRQGAVHGGLPDPSPFVPTSPQGDHHGPEDHRFHLHRLLGLRPGVPQRRHPRKGRRLHHRPGQVHRVRGPLRLAPVRGGVPGRWLHREGLNAMLPNVTVNPAAEKFMRRMVRFSGAGRRAGFRLTVSAGGCSGYSSEFTVEAAPLAGDEVLSVGASSSSCRPNRG
jgi:predicted Fe-Mo cluster-binding NifX family protein